MRVSLSQDRLPLSMPPMLILRFETARRHEPFACMHLCGFLPWPYALACRCRVELAPGVDYVRTADVKDQIELTERQRHPGCVHDQ